MQSQGRRVGLRPEFRGNLEDIFSDLSMPYKKGKLNPKSAAVADIVTIGGSWLNFAIKKDLIDPIQGVENQDWYRNLNDKWKVRILIVLSFDVFVYLFLTFVWVLSCIQVIYVSGHSIISSNVQKVIFFFILAMTLKCLLRELAGHI